MSNGILIDRRCFYMDSNPKTWMNQYMEQGKRLLSRDFNLLFIQFCQSNLKGNIIKHGAKEVRRLSANKLLVGLKRRAGHLLAQRCV